MTFTLRPATAADAGAVRENYAPVVRETAISFETEQPDSDEMAARIDRKRARFPWLACTREGSVVGYAYASPYRERAAYRWSVEVSVYVHADWRRHGVARGLYTSLLSVLELLGYANAAAVIALPNPESVSFHESLGFEHVGTHHEVGYKHGTWHDVGHWELSIQSHGADPPEPIPAATRRGSDAYRVAVASGESGLGD